MKASYSIEVKRGLFIGWLAAVTMTPEYPVAPGELPSMAIGLQGPSYWRPTQLAALRRAERHIARRRRAELRQEHATVHIR